MLRLFVSAVVALVLCAGVGLTQDKGKAKNKTTQGTIKKVDAATGTLTVSVKGKAGAEPTTKEFKVDEATKVSVYSEGQQKPTELTGKAGLKDPQVKEGATVAVVTDDTGKVVRIRVNQPKKPKKDAK